METNKYLLRVDRKDIVYLRGTIESYDGMAVVSTLDPQEAIIVVQVSPGCDCLFLELINHMARFEPVQLSFSQGAIGGLTPAP
jgi:hypothetical protein